jgi:hypothetical protein
VRRFIAGLLTASLIAAITPAAMGAGGTQIGTAKRIYHPNGPGDATVVAILDFGLNPYHWDFASSKMPQNVDSDMTNDLPLNESPDKWLPGYPNPKKEFASFNRLELTLDEKRADTSVESLKALDQAKLTTIKPSTPDDRNVYWIPNTKVIGAMTLDGSNLVGGVGDHGVGTTSSAVGNLHGTCPECLLFFIQLGSTADSEKAIDWAMNQPWIDAISNSYGFSTGVRDRLYSGSNVEAQRKATERGQTVFFSAGNGNDGSYGVPNTTSFSSQEGPDWIVTVGATSPGEDNYYYRDDAQGLPFEPLDKTAYHSSYFGHGKPSDISGIGGNYPSAYTSDTVGGTGDSGFGGTSNATPQITGTYARALYLARRALDGASKIQRDGVIARGAGVDCGKVRRNCELGDGVLTAAELRRRLFFGAQHTTAGMTGPTGVGELPAIGEEEFMNEGHGSYFGRETGRLKDYLAEFARVFDPMVGRAKELDRPAGEREWMIVDSFCRQHLWGSWKGGYYVEGKTDLPGTDPSAPLRSAIETGCPYLEPPL